MKILNFSLGQLFVHFQLFIYFPEISHLEALVLFYDGGPAKFIPRFYAVLIGTQSL